MRLISLSSSHATFRRVEFHEGLNAVLAERTDAASQTDSRNGLGKTTLLALIDFCLGARYQSGDRLSQLAGEHWEFTLEFARRNGEILRATRSIDDPSAILVQGHVVAAGLADEDVTLEGAMTEVRVGIGRWNEWLGNEMFGAALTRDVGAPSYRSLLRHFLRYQLAAFVKPFATFSNQPAADVQAENAFLLNLDWRLAKQWEELKTRKRRIDLADDPEESVEDQIAALESRVIRLRRQAEALASQIDNFEVVPEYREVESDVAHTSRRIKEIANENVGDRQIAESYETRLRDEFASSNIDIERLFEEAGLTLGEGVIRNLEQAAEFQQQVVANRAAYLDAELRRIQDRIVIRQAEQEALSRRQSDALKLLRSGGALEDFAVMQQKLTAAQAAASEVDQRIQMLRELRDRKAQLKADELDLSSRTALDLRERFGQREAIISRFGEILDNLYGETADLEVGSGPAGFRFRVDLPRSGSSGVEKMAIFAYTLAITEYMAAQNSGPGFLVHDSIMFDGVDERQIAMALEISSEAANRLGFQYLITMNTDVVPWAELHRRDEFEASVVLSLTDESPAGGLLGVRLHFELDEVHSTE